MVEGARLESVYTGNRIAGSNPALSARYVLQNQPQHHATAGFLVGYYFSKVTVAKMATSSGFLAGSALNSARRSRLIFSPLFTLK